jgi:hypothetical protein
MPVDKGRYKKGMFLIGPDHPGLGIVKLIVTSRSGPSQRARSVSPSRAMRSLKQRSGTTMAANSARSALPSRIASRYRVKRWGIMTEWHLSSPQWTMTPDFLLASCTSLDKFQGPKAAVVGMSLPPRSARRFTLASFANRYLRRSYRRASNQRVLLACKSAE